VKHCNENVLDLPIALPTTVLLDLCRVGIGMARFGEVSREMLLLLCGTIGKTGVVAVSVLVGSSHCIN
jgi:hypothetical protein